MNLKRKEACTYTVYRKYLRANWKDKYYFCIIAYGNLDSCDEIRRVTIKGSWHQVRNGEYSGPPCYDSIAVCACLLINYLFLHLFLLYKSVIHSSKRLCRIKMKDLGTLMKREVILCEVL